MGVIKLLLLFVTVSESCRSSVKVKKSNLSLPPPHLRLTRFEEGGRVTFFLDPVKSDPANPILGYKIKLWEDEKKNNTFYEEWNKMTEYEKIQSLINHVPQREPTFEAVLPPDVLNATFVLKAGEGYQLRRQSFNADGDGPYSGYSGINQVYKLNQLN